MKNTIRTFLIFLLSIVMVLSFAGCSKSDEDAAADAGDEVEVEDELADEAEDYEEPELIEDDEEDPYDNGIVFDEESEGAELKFKDTSAEDFFGTWEATSGQALYYYGNIYLDIKSNGKWTGNVADEDLKGKWAFKDNSLKLTSDLFQATLSYTTDGVLILTEDRDGITLNTVLTKAS